MSGKQSSFHMGNEFNGYGETVYLKADTCELPPVSQKNVQLTPDYSSYALKAVGGIAVVLNPENMDDIARAMLGSMPALNYVAITKNEANGRYDTSFKVSSHGLIDTSYRTGKPTAKGIKGSEDFFVVTSGNLKVKRKRTTQDGKKGNEYLIALIGSGQQIKVVTQNGKYVSGLSEDDTNDYEWIKVMCMPDKKYALTGEEGKEIEGWVPRIYIRKDGKRIIKFSESNGFNHVAMVKKFKDTPENKKKNRIGSETNYVNSVESWSAYGKGDYPQVCPSISGRWKVAVAPGIVDWEYKSEGKVEMDDIKGFSKYIKVFLNLKDKYKGDSSKKKTLSFECYVGDIKAHSYNIYPYIDEVKKRTDKSNSYFVSDYIDSASASVYPGYIQTGIRYPNANNESVVSFNNMDGSVIEFCGYTVTGLGFKPEEYQLDYIEVNYETTTRGKSLFSK